MDDAFGGMVSSLFEEFEKDRESTGTFITYDKTEEGKEDKSKIVFRIGDPESESSSSSESEDENESRDESKVDTNESEKFAEEEEEPRIELNGQEEPVFNNEQTSQHKLLHESILNFESFSNLGYTGRSIHNLEKKGFPVQYDKFSTILVLNTIEEIEFYIFLLKMHVPDEWSPACQVIYHNNSFSRKYRPMIENFISSLLYRHMREGNQQLPELPLKSSTLTCVDANKSLPVTLRNNVMWKSHAIIGCGQYHQYFLVDTVGWTLVDYNPALTDGWERPKYPLFYVCRKEWNYEQIFEEAIPVDEEDENAGPKGPERLKASCFNCGGEHMITDCKEEKDFQRIRQNRNAFLQQQQQSKLQRPSSVRYHKDSDVDPKFSKFRPGHIGIFTF
ncbi:hypothetical protein KUTeg_010177 [Tegillarca granosa]|uniref:Uncharacterized protein n=1 Tax=Tegillarca granosa TaxID=220873 RepID=A0ABQ9F5Z7_TEGGR|nr:hypothetical protein KUTeg_010177 [Tegillarca granosa]